MKFEKPWHNITDHHIIPKSLWWNRHFHNIAKLKQVKHRALHTMHENNLPHEQLLDIIDLTGQDGNAFSVIGYVAKIMKKEGKTTKEIEAYREEAMSGDYDNVLCTSLDMLDELNE